MAIRVTRTGVVLAVGILVGAAILFGLLQIVRDRGEQARREEAISIAEENLQAESEEGVAIEVTEDETEETSQGTNDVAVSESSVLPQTGPEFGAIVAVGAVTFVTVSYVRSRRLAFKQF